MCRTITLRVSLNTNSLLLYHQIEIEHLFHKWERITLLYRKKPRECIAQIIPLGLQHYWLITSRRNPNTTLTIHLFHIFIGILFRYHLQYSIQHRTTTVSSRQGRTPPRTLVQLLKAIHHSLCDELHDFLLFLLRGIYSKSHLCI